MVTLGLTRTHDLAGTRLLLPAGRGRPARLYTGWLGSGWLGPARLGLMLGRRSLRRGWRWFGGGKVWLEFVGRARGEAEAFIAAIGPEQDGTGQRRSRHPDHLADGVHLHNRAPARGQHDD